MKVLFLCTANINRSKTAEDHFRLIDGSNKYKSAGLSKKYCQKHGTQLCTIELLEWAEQILVMEATHLDRITENTGEKYHSKIEVLHVEDI